MLCKLLILTVFSMWTSEEITDNLQVIVMSDILASKNLGSVLWSINLVPRSSMVVLIAAVILFCIKNSSCICDLCSHPKTTCIFKALQSSTPGFELFFCSGKA